MLVANVVLNEVPNNNDITHVKNVGLNEAPKSNDAMRIASNVCLTTIGTQQCSMGGIIAITQKS